MGGWKGPWRDKVGSFGDRTLRSGPDSGPISTTRSVASEFPKEETSGAGCHAHNI